MDEYEGMLTKNSIWLGRTKGVGILTRQDVLDWGLLGPIARASGVNYDVRRAFPYLTYATYDFEVPTQQVGDVYARYQTRVAEMRESWRICKQAIAADHARPAPGAWTTRASCRRPRTRSTRRWKRSSSTS